MTHQSPPEAATVYFFGDARVKLECEDCGYATEYDTYPYAKAAFNKHCKENAR